MAGSMHEVCIRCHLRSVAFRVALDQGAEPHEVQHRDGDDHALPVYAPESLLIRVRVPPVAGRCGKCGHQVHGVEIYTSYTALPIGHMAYSLDPRHALPDHPGAARARGPNGSRRAPEGLPPAVIAPDSRLIYSPAMSTIPEKLLIGLVSISDRAAQGVYRTKAFRRWRSGSQRALPEPLHVDAAHTRTSGR